MATTSDESNQPEANRPRRRRVRSLLLVLVLLVTAAVGVEWLLSHRFEARIVEAGGQLFVDSHRRPSLSAFTRLRNRLLNPAARSKDDRIHHIRFVNGAVDDEWLKQYRDEIENLSGQTWLTLRDSGVTSDGLAALRGVSSVFTIDVSGTPLTASALDHLATMPDLWNLDISQTGIPDSAMRVFSEFRVLQCVAVDASQATDQGIAHICEIPQLVELILVAPTVETLSHLPNASSLTIKDGTITPEMLAAFVAMEQLQALTFVTCHFHECSEEQLRAAIPKCKVSVAPAEGWFQRELGGGFGQAF